MKKQSILCIILVPLLLSCSSDSASHNNPAEMLPDEVHNAEDQELQCSGAVSLLPDEERPQDGTPLPKEIMSDLTKMQTSLSVALHEKNEENIRQTVCNMRKVLGQWQGVAAAPAEYLPIEGIKEDPGAVKSEYLSGLKSVIESSASWILTEGKTHGSLLKVPLRAPCNMIRWALSGSFIPSQFQSTLRNHAADGLAWLMKVQRSQGHFAFPDLSDDAQVFMDQCQVSASEQECYDALPRSHQLAYRGKMEWREQGSPEGVIVDGWFVDDSISDPGGLQFDTGECGRALLDGYQVFKDKSMLEAARRAGRWAQSQPMVPNWNYNAFSVGLLAMLEQRDEAQKGTWLKAALAKAKLGVIPGVLPNGRFFDPHNARLDYHLIVTAAMARLVMVSEDEQVAQTLKLMLGRTRKEFLNQGPVGIDDAIEAYLLLQQKGYQVQDVLDVIVDGGIRDNVPTAGGIGYWLAGALQAK